MKKKFTRIVGIGLTFVLLASLMAFGAPVSAGTLAWGAESIPGATNEVIEDVDIADIAVYDADIIWVGGGEALLYKTTDGGVTWSALDPTSDNDTDLVAVAPDNSDIVAYVDTDLDQVWVTTNGGTTWGSLGTPAETSGSGAATEMYDIAISADSAGTHYIAVAGERTGPVADVWYYNIGAAAPAWYETNALAGFSDTTADVAKAVAFSPNFPSDKVMVALIESDNVSITLEILHFVTTKAWNTSAGTFTGYPAAVVTDDGITDLTSGSITLSPDYLGSDDAMRLVFVGLTLAGDAGAVANNGIWRMSDYSPKALKIGAAYEINSVAYNGTNLVAGRYDSNIVYRSDDPTATTPTVSGATTRKRPGVDISGDEMTLVAWAGDKVVAGTSLANSAFAVSENDGKTFNDISLVDGLLTDVTDVAVSADGSKVYMVTDDGTYVSLWRQASSWERVLTFADTSNYIVRIAPDDPDVVYVAEQAGTDIYYSNDGGETRWHLRASSYNIQDLAIEGDGDVAYVAVDSAITVSKSTNAGFTWATAKSTKLVGGDGHMLVSISEDNLLIGSTDGYVSYSTDGNSTWTKISSRTETGATEVQLIADGLADDNFIYAASDTQGDSIRRWQIGTSTSWSDIYSGTISGGVFGLTLSEGVLSALSVYTTDNQSTLNQCLTPTTATSATVWGTSTTLTTTDATDEQVQLNSTPQGLRVSSGSQKLWAVKTNDTNRLYSFSDTLMVEGPTLRAPANLFTDPVNPVTGRAANIAFSWERLSTATAYNLYIAYDEDFKDLVITVAVTSSLATVSQVLGPSIEVWTTAPGDTEALTTVEFTPGETYYWRVKATAPLYSLYSETRSLTVAEAEVVAPIVVPAPVVEVAPPEVTVDVAPPEVTVTVPPVEIPPAIPSYMLWIIIGIGGVLIIALIVLILRTRRAV